MIAHESVSRREEQRSNKPSVKQIEGRTVLLEDMAVGDESWSNLWIWVGHFGSGFVVCMLSSGNGTSTQLASKGVWIQVLKGAFAAIRELDLGAHCRR